MTIAVYDSNVAVNADWTRHSCRQTTDQRASRRKSWCIPSLNILRMYCNVPAVGKMGISLLFSAIAIFVIHVARAAASYSGGGQELCLNTGKAMIGNENATAVWSSSQASCN